MCIDNAQQPIGARAFAGFVLGLRARELKQGGRRNGIGGLHRGYAFSSERLIHRNRGKNRLDAR